MAIEKRIQTGFEIVEAFDSTLKTANYQPEVYVPPEILEFIRGLTPDPRFAYVHTIAMSDGNSYGSNLNGDIFTADELTGTQSPEEAMKNPGESRGVQKPRYKTFEDARFFRHHDNRESSPFYGDVPLAAWNAPMRRVELIIRVAREPIPELGMQGAPDIIVKLDRRGYICVSMGTRIDHEECSYCHAKNAFVSQRCDHLRNQMHQIMPNGVKVAAINYGTRYFDISDVTVPADPVASSLAKVASAGPSVSSGNLARDVVMEKVCRWLQKLSEIEKEIPPDSLGTSCTNCPSGDERPPRDFEPWTPEELSQAAKAANYDLETVLATTTAAGVLLDPVELALVTCLCEPSAKLASAPEDIQGFESIRLDRFSRHVYDAFRERIASRSGFTAHVQVAEWEPAKIAEHGGSTVARYYDYYRASLGALSRSAFIKAANRIPEIRDLHDGNMTRLRAGMCSLV